MHQEFLRHLLRYKADALNEVVNVIGGALFAECFIPWVEGLREPAPDLTTSPEVIAIEGKILRRTHSRNRDRGPPQLLFAWASSQRLVLGQQACQAKFNEITAFPPPARRLALTGALVPIGAMGCQTKIAQAILHRRRLFAGRQRQRGLCARRDQALSR